MWLTTSIGRYPDTGAPIPGGMSLYRINTTEVKNALATKLAIPPADPGAFHLHGEVGHEYMRHMTAEYRDEQGLWQCPKHRGEHFWDCEVLAFAAADAAGMKHWPTPDDSQPEPQHTSENRAPRRRRRW